jgi:hypothetical protein
VGTKHARCQHVSTSAHQQILISRTVRRRSSIHLGQPGCLGAKIKQAKIKQAKMKQAKIKFATALTFMRI